MTHSSPETRPAGLGSLAPRSAGDPGLLAELRAEVAAAGPLTFARFMELALYHPTRGYYSRRPGARDYASSPTVHPLFGALIARQLRRWWEELGSPAPFHAVEVGGGDGRLARDVRAAAAADRDFAAALVYHFVEHRLPPALEPPSPHPPTPSPPGGEGGTPSPPTPLPAGEGSAAAVLLPSPAGRRVGDEGGDWAGVVGHRALAELAPGSVGCVLSNELVDAFPVHRVTVEGGELQELYVGWRDWTDRPGGRLVEMVGPPSTPRLAAALRQVGVWPAEGVRTEVCLRAAEWLGEVAAVLGRGYVLTIDYGHEAAEYYAPSRRDGTLLCYYRHAAHGDPLVGVGEQDITAHADFTLLRRRGEELGLATVELTTQRAYLERLGARELAAELARAAPTPARRYAARFAVAELLARSGLGSFRVLVQRRR